MNWYLKVWYFKSRMQLCTVDKLASRKRDILKVSRVNAGAILSIGNGVSMYLEHLFWSLHTQSKDTPFPHEHLHFVLARISSGYIGLKKERVVMTAGKMEEGKVARDSALSLTTVSFGLGPMCFQVSRASLGAS